MPVKNTWLIALSGTNGSGKDTVGQLIADEHGFLFFSVTDLLRQECVDRNIPIVRSNTKIISEEWRAKYGPSVLVDKAIDEYNKVKSSYKGLVLASMRNKGEADKIHELGGTMVWIDADPKLRFKRVQMANRTNRYSEDNKTFEEFLADEEAENHSGGDPNKIGTAEIKDKCDVFIDNDSDLATLKKKINQTLFS